MSWWSGSLGYRLIVQLWKSREKGQPSRGGRRGRTRRFCRPQIDCILEDRTLLATPTSLSLAASLPVPVFGQTITLTGTLTAVDDSTPTGTVQFYDGSALLGQTGLNGVSANDQATLQVSSLSVGSHSLRATYAGDTDHAASHSPDLAETVSRVETATTLTADSNAWVDGQAVNLVATVSAVSPGTGTPTGTVSFYDGGVSLGSVSLDGAGHATLYVNSMAASAQHALTASYGGDSAFAGSNSAPPGLTIEQTPNLSPTNPGSSTGTITLAIFSYGGPLTDYTAQVDWGDGTASTQGTITAGSGGRASASGEHTYTSSGTYRVQVTIFSIVQAATGTATIMVMHDELTGTAFPINAEEAPDFVLDPVASFTDVNANATPSDFQAYVDWGDGHVTAVGVVADGNGGFDVGYPYSYTSLGTYNVTVTIIKDNGSHLVLSTTANITDYPLSPTVTAFPISATGGDAVEQYVASFVAGVDDPASQFTATIDWGDGTVTTGVVSRDPSGLKYLVKGNHTYASSFDTYISNYTTTVTVTNTGQEGDFDVTACDSNLVTVGPGEPLISVNVESITVTEGHLFTGDFATISFPDGGVHSLDVLIDWGDGAPYSDGLGSYDEANGWYGISGSHLYLFAGTYQITVTVFDLDDIPYCLSNTGVGTASVTEAPFNNATVVAQSSPLSTTEGVPLNNITVATFSCADSTLDAGQFSATIVWGDGNTTTGTVSGGNGSFQVQGNHTYADPGNFGLTVYIDGFTFSTTTATVSAAEFMASGLEDALSVPAGHMLHHPVLATFTDADTADSASDFTATVYWGDGSQPFQHACL